MDLDQSVLPERIRIDDILEKMVQYRPDADVELVRRAFVLSSVAHKNQLRRSGEPYLVHPLSVAYFVTEWRLDEVSIAAALIHDTLEDAPQIVGRETLEKTVGREVVQIVEALTKLEKHRFESHTERQAEYFIRMLMAATEDPRVLYVKLADRLHNMMTLDAMPRDKQIKIAQETQAIYVPLALRLGIGQAYALLSDLCLKYLDPTAYRRILDFIREHGPVAQEALAQIECEIAEELEARGITSATLQKRIKRPSSIYRKIQRKGVELEDILDFLGIRIIVDTVGQCYEVLGIVHQKWNYIPGEFDDYVALPKPNNYQSIHTAILYPWKDRLVPVEIQIRTYEMHEIAERGLAAHIIYKGAVPGDDPRYLRWIREVSRLKDTATSPDQYLKHLQELMDFDRIYVFTPKQEIIELPRGATPLDFAFHIHTDIGLKCHRARVNGRLVDLGYRLKSGDTVEILTHPAQEPTEDWLDLVVSKRARHKIRAYLRRKQAQAKEERAEKGRRILDRVLREFPGVSQEEAITALRRGLSVKAPDQRSWAEDRDVLAAIGGGLVTVQRLRSIFSGWTEDREASLLKRILRPFARRIRPTSQLILQTQDSPLVVPFRRASCCAPLPGEPVLLYMTKRARRLPTLHRMDCPRVQSLDPARVQKNVEWFPGQEEAFVVPLRIIVEDRAGMLADILEVFSNMHINLQHVQGMVRNERGEIVLVAQLRDYGMLERAIQQVMKVKGVYELKRLGLDALSQPVH